MFISVSGELMVVLYAIYVLLIASSVLVVVAETGNAAKSLAWILALIFLPGVGLLLYLFFGQSLRGDKLNAKVDRKRMEELNNNSAPNVESLQLSDENMQLIMMCHKMTHAHYYPNNDVQVFLKGKEKFDSLLHDIRNAKEFIHIQYFIYNDDNLGRKVGDALVDAVKRGVEVRLLYDDMGCFTVNRNYFRQLRKQGVQTCAFMKILRLRPSLRINFRNHRKIVVIDGRIGYIGGMNVADRYVNDENGLWRDTHMRIEGPAVRGLQLSFAVDWSTEREFLGDERYYPEIAPVGNKGVQIIQSGPIEEWDNIEMACVKIVSMARKSIYIQTPYFLPTSTLVDALQVAALSGVDVRIMMPYMTDWRVMRYGSFSYISQMLSAGVKVYLYMPGMMHSKTIVVDNQMLSVGSANFDFRSFEHNFEANAMVFDEEIAKQARRDFMKDVESCKLIDNLEEWRKRSFLHKVCESVVRLISPVL